MSVKSQNERILLGLKVKQHRQSKKLSFAELAKASGLSVSYLNEIEKGKKYPKPDKLNDLARALDVSMEELTASELQNGLAPVAELLKSNFLNELPLDLFGIELAKVVEIIANAPTRVGAFISTLLEISRNYALQEENFYFGALRSYLELHHNYFQELEEAVDAFSKKFGLSPSRPLPVAMLEELLEKEFGYTIVADGLAAYPELQGLRSLFLPKSKKLLLSSKLDQRQTAFQLGKELGFQWLGLKERAYTSSILRGRVFEEVLNHSKAIYFSVALHMPLNAIQADMRAFFQRPQWNGEAFLAIMRKYDVSPEMLYHRLTNILPRFFGMKQLFFLRFVHQPERDAFQMDKELHLSRKHHPHGNNLSEHYCRRWVALSLLHDLKSMQEEGKYADTLVRAQRSRFHDTEDEYLCLTLARAAYPSPDQNVSVTLGLEINPTLRRQVAFLDDPAIQRREVNRTCERCAIPNCSERAAPPLIIQQREAMQKVSHRLQQLLEQG